MGEDSLPRSPHHPSPITYANRASHRNRDVRHIERRKEQSLAAAEATTQDQRKTIERRRRDRDRKMQTHGRVVEAQREYDGQDPGVEGQKMDRGATDIGDANIRAATTRGNRDAGDLFSLSERGDGRIAEQGRRDAETGDYAVEAIA